MEAAAYDIQGFVDFLLRVEASLVVVEGDVSLDGGLCDSFRSLGGGSIVHLVGV